MLRSKWLVAAVSFTALAGCGGGGPESASHRKLTGSEKAAAVRAVKIRQANYEEIGRAMKGIKDELKKDAPRGAVIHNHARTIDRLAPQIVSWFPRGSGAEAGVKTEAKAEIWSRPHEFHRVAANFAAAASRFNAIAASADPAAIRKGVKPLGIACKACHEFRGKD